MNQKVFSRQNVNLFTALLVFLVITGIAGLFLASLYSYNSGLEQIADKIEATLSGDEISDPEGYGLLVNSIVYGMGALGLWLARIILWAAVIYHVFLAVFAGVLRLIFAQTPGRLLAYRIVTGFYCFFILAEILLLFSAINAVTLVLILSLLLVLAVTLVNTYSHIEVIPKNGTPLQNETYYKE